MQGKRLKIFDSPSLVLEDFSELEKDLMAVVFQHEIDHQFEILISDIGKEFSLSIDKSGTYLLHINTLDGLIVRKLVKIY